MITPVTCATVELLPVNKVGLTEIFFLLNIAFSCCRSLRCPCESIISMSVSKVGLGKLLAAKTILSGTC